MASANGRHRMPPLLLLGLLAAAPARAAVDGTIPSPALLDRMEERYRTVPALPPKLKPFVPAVPEELRELYAELTEKRVTLA